MKGEIGRLRQVVCELVEKISGGVGRVQREVVNCSTQIEASVVTVCATSQGAAGGKGVVCEPGVSTQTKEVGCIETTIVLYITIPGIFVMSKSTIVVIFNIFYIVHIN